MKSNSETLCGIEKTYEPHGELGRAPVQPRRGIDLYGCAYRGHRVTPYECHRLHNVGACPDVCEKWQSAEARADAAEARRMALHAAEPDKADETIFIGGRELETGFRKQSNSAVPLLDEDGELAGWICERCETPKLIGDFYARHSTCKKCMSEIAKARRDGI